MARYVWVPTETTETMSQRPQSYKQAELDAAFAMAQFRGQPTSTSLADKPNQEVASETLKADQQGNRDREVVKHHLNPSRQDKSRAGRKNLIVSSNKAHPHQKAGWARMLSRKTFRRLREQAVRDAEAMQAWVDFVNGAHTTSSVISEGEEDLARRIDAFCSEGWLYGRQSSPCQCDWHAEPRGTGPMDGSFGWRPINGSVG